MAKFVVQMSHGEFLCAGEVVRESASNFFVRPIEGCLHSHPGRMFDRKNVVFETDDVAKVIRLMAIYSLATKQRDAVVNAANNAYREVLAAITAGRKV